MRKGRKTKVGWDFFISTSSKGGLVGALGLFGGWGERCLLRV